MYTKLARSWCLIPEGTVTPMREQRFDSKPEAPGPDFLKPAAPPADTSIISQITYLSQKTCHVTRDMENRDQRSRQLVHL